MLGIPVYDRFNLARNESEHPQACLMTRGLICILLIHKIPLAGLQVGHWFRGTELDYLTRNCKRYLWHDWNFICCPKSYRAKLFYAWSGTPCLPNSAE